MTPGFWTAVQSVFIVLRLFQGTWIAILLKFGESVYIWYYSKFVIKWESREQPHHLISAAGNHTNQLVNWHKNVYCEISSSDPVMAESAVGMRRCNFLYQ